MRIIDFITSIIPGKRHQASPVLPKQTFESLGGAIISFEEDEDIQKADTTASVEDNTEDKGPYGWERLDGETCMRDEPYVVINYAAAVVKGASLDKARKDLCDDTLEWVQDLSKDQLFSLAGPGVNFDDILYTLDDHLAGKVLMPGFPPIARTDFDESRRKEASALIRLGEKDRELQDILEYARATSAEERLAIADVMRTRTRSWCKELQRDGGLDIVAGMDIPLLKEHLSGARPYYDLKPSPYAPDRSVEFEALREAIVARAERRKWPSEIVALVNMTDDHELVDLEERLLDSAISGDWSPILKEAEVYWPQPRSIDSVSPSP